MHFMWTSIDKVKSYAYMSFSSIEHNSIFVSMSEWSNFVHMCPIVLKCLSIFFQFVGGSQKTHDWYDPETDLGVLEICCENIFFLPDPKIRAAENHLDLWHRNETFSKSFSGRVRLGVLFYGKLPTMFTFWETLSTKTGLHWSKFSILFKKFVGF